MSINLTDKEITQLMKGFVIVADSRETKNLHVLQHFTDNNIEYVIKKIDTGDYTCYVKAVPELGILRDIYIPSLVERKMGCDELASNLQKSTETRFVNELIRSKDYNFVILVEDAMAYPKFIHGQYRSGYKPDALIGRLNSLKARFGFEMVYLDSRFSGDWIYRHLYYATREYLKNL